MTKFEINSGKIRISDPCYEKDDVLGGMILPAKNGTWIAHVEFMDMGAWGDRISNLTVEFTGPNKQVNMNRDKIFVDSGQAGVFDLDSYANKKVVKNVKRIHNESVCEADPWYSICCDRTLSNKQWGTIPNGVVSTSGVGDGCYEVVYYLDNDGLATRVEINFIIEDEADEED